LNNNKKPYLICPLPEEALINAKEATRLLRQDPDNDTVAKKALQAIVDIMQASLNDKKFKVS
jgi:hypothetical protein